MANSGGPPNKDKKRNPRAALDPLTTDAMAGSSTSSSGPSKLEVVSKAIMAPFHRRVDSNRILSELAPVIMTPRMMSSAGTVSSRPKASLRDKSSNSSHALDFATLGRAPLRMTLGGRRVTSRDLQIVEATEELLDAEVPEPEGVASDVSFLRGFNATIPSAEKSRSRRRQTRNLEVGEKLGLKRLGMSARGLLTEEEGHESVVSEEDMVMVGDRGRKERARGRRRGRESMAAGKKLGVDELRRQSDEIKRDKENLHVKRKLINNEIVEITHKIEALDKIRQKLERDLLKLQEEDLELEDELEGVREQLEVQASARGGSQRPSSMGPQSSRRRKGPVFLPSEHDDLPPGVAFMSLESHQTPITALDFSEPYGTLVTASQEDTQPRVWDLLTGEEIGRLRGHRGSVKCIQVEGNMCLTGGEDGTVRLWDLERVDEDDDWEGVGELSVVAEETDESHEDDGLLVEKPNDLKSIRNDTNGSLPEKTGPCVRVLEGHTKAVSTIYFEDDCLVTGASDKTLRQWDLSTGQCVMTMDILWAISHPTSSTPGSTLPAHLIPGAAAAAGSFAVPTPPYADGSWEMYQDFVGAVQFWGYALVSGSGDGAVRMWDMRTGQPHRTLLGHTGPVTCLQFDELHIASGSLDKSIRIWDLRTGGIFETLKYDHAVTALQFDSRKIVAATGENGIKIYNRTSMQHSTLLTNGHTRPVERLRYMDRYLVSGGRDAMVKIWAL
ncbi:WD40 repeat-like protein [Heliocybe sulcata]|uniref:WD40 repeat-like protein n=1 Tax=Heliocybe sulcata TaxID=5364 RepID=A0A5C3NIH0_9AGAM|nr:WD40 repeat-like protein [Heliocybe sulcata]